MVINVLSVHIIRIWINTVIVSLLVIGAKLGIKKLEIAQVVSMDMENQSKESAVVLLFKEIM